MIDAHTLSRFGFATLAAQEPDIDIVAEASSIAAARRLGAANRAQALMTAVCEGLIDSAGAMNQLRA